MNAEQEKGAKVKWPKFTRALAATRLPLPRWWAQRAAWLTGWLPILKKGQHKRLKSSSERVLSLQALTTLLCVGDVGQKGGEKGSGDMMRCSWMVLIFIQSKTKLPTKLEDEITAANNNVIWCAQSQTGSVVQCYYSIIIQIKLFWRVRLHLNDAEKNVWHFLTENDYSLMVVLVVAVPEITTRRRKAPAQTWLQVSECWIESEAEWHPGSRHR